jgi:hypothetical protein
VILPPSSSLGDLTPVTILLCNYVYHCITANIDDFSKSFETDIFYIFEIKFCKKSVFLLHLRSIPCLCLLPPALELDYSKMQEK